MRRSFIPNFSHSCCVNSVLCINALASSECANSWPWSGCVLLATHFTPDAAAQPLGSAKFLPIVSAACARPETHVHSARCAASRTQLSSSPAASNKMPTDSRAYKGKPWLSSYRAASADAADARTDGSVSRANTAHSSRTNEESLPPTTGTQ